MKIRFSTFLLYYYFKFYIINAKFKEILMIRAAIVDDDLSEQDNVRKMIDAFSNENNYF